MTVDRNTVRRFNRSTLRNIRYTELLVRRLAPRKERKRHAI